MSAAETNSSHSGSTHQEFAKMTQYCAGRSHDDVVAARAAQRQRAREQAGGDMAIEGTEADEQHSCGELSELGKQVWRRGSGIDGGGMVLVPVRRGSR